MIYFFVIFAILLVNFFVILTKKGGPYPTRIVHVVIFLLFCFVMFRVDDSPDIINYQYMYNSLHQKEGGFSLIINLCNKLGWTYFQFQKFYYLISFSILNLALYRLSSQINSVYVFVGYFLYPFLLNLVQMRNFMVLSIVTYAFSICYSEENNTKRLFKWAVLIGLAATQHILALAYLPFCFLMNHHSILKKLSFFVGGVTIVFIPFRAKIVLMINAVLSSLGVHDNRIDGFDNPSILGLLMTLFFAFLMVLVVVLGYNLLKEAKKDSKFIEFVKNLFIYSICFWPFYLINGNYTRLIQNFSVIFYVFFVFLIKKKVLKMDGLSLIIVTSFSFVCFINVYNLWFGLYETVILPVLNNKTLLYCLIR